MLISKLKPLSGSISFGELFSTSNNHIYFSLDEPDYPRYVSGIEWIQFVLKSYEKRFDQERFDELIELLSFPEVYDSTNTYSFGMDKKLSMLVAFLLNCPFTFFDESLAGIDPYTLKNIYTYLNNFKKGKVVIISSHSKDLIESCADKLFFLKDGNLNEITSFDEIFES